ncbi:hypothetical protein [Kiloniella antarctica]|uniref:Uncharacterized protein n=1 Tax=Kiloniella antarctica TaxID=1550907 RepID=A0ABW5BP53_9PROT
MGIENYSTTPANNNGAPPNGAPEGMTPGAVNDVMRQIMADVRTQAEEGCWFNWGHTPTYVAADKFSVTGDQTADYTVGRRVRLLDTTEKFGVITVSAYTSLTTVTVVLDSGSLVAPTVVSLGIDPLVLEQGGLATKDTVDTAEIVDGAVTAAKLASGLTINAVDAEARSTLARLDFTQASQHSLDRQDNDNGITDVFTDDSDIDTGASVSEIYDSSGDYYTNKVVTVIAGGTGTPIGNMTDLGGLSSAFDGVTVQGTIASARAGTNITTGYIGKTWSSPKTIAQYTIYGTSDYGFDQGTETITVTLQGSNDAFAAQIVDLHTDTFANAAGISKDYSTGITTSTAYSSHRAKIEIGSPNETRCAELVFYESTAGTNITLQSTAFTADATPSTADLYVWQEDVDAVTLNTDLKGYVSRDGGTTWTEVTLVEVNTMTAGRMLSAVGVDISAQPSGTSMKYKFQTFNDKEQRIHGVSFQWRA